MAIYKTISSKYIIAKVYRDIGLEDPNYESSMFEWIGEALEFIGSGPAIVQKEQDLIVTDYKALLPMGLVTLNQVLYRGDDGPGYFMKNNPVSINRPFDDGDGNNLAGKETYFVNGDYLVTSFEEGEVTVSYMTFETDKDGFPLVPDNQYFREALFWYCFKKILMSGYTPKNKDMNYEVAENQWRFYCTGARNKANYPDIGQYQRFADIWVGLIPPKRLFEKGFNLEDPKPFYIETVRADNLVTRPLTVEKPDESPSSE